MFCKKTLKRKFLMIIINIFSSQIVKNYRRVCEYVTDIWNYLPFHDNKYYEF